MKEIKLIQVNNNNIKELQGKLIITDLSFKENFNNITEEVYTIYYDVKDNQYFIIINDIRYNINYDSNDNIIINNPLKNQKITFSSLKYENIQNNTIKKITNEDLSTIEITSKTYKIIKINEESKDEKDISESNDYIYVWIIISLIIIVIILLFIYFFFGK